MSLFSGTVRSGGSKAKPQSGARVTLFEAGPNQPVVLGQAISDESGFFSITSPIDSTSGIFYGQADLGNGIVMIAVLGPTLPSSVVVINELTTIAGAYCAAQFISNGTIQGDGFRLQIAAGMNRNLVTVDGNWSDVIFSSPNGGETTALSTLASLACLLALCVRRGGESLVEFLDAATPPFGDAPKDTVTAFSNIARHPANHVGVLYYLSKLCPIYGPALFCLPDAWTIPVKVKDSGNDEHMFGGPANIVFDARGNAWITNNVVQGEDYSTLWCIVLDATGRPARDPNGALMSPFTGGGLRGAGFGIDLDAKGRIWIGDFGWGGETQYYPKGSVSVFDENARPLSPEPEGYWKHLYRVQGVVADSQGNVWMASYGNGRVVVYLGGDQDNAVVYQSDPSAFKPFDIAIAADGTAWVTNSASQGSGVVNLQLKGGTLEPLRSTTIGKTNKGIAIDSNEVIWIGSGGDDHVYALDKNGAYIGGYQGGGLSGPWGVSLDGDENLWVANFGLLEAGSVFTGRLTVLASSRSTNYRMGDAISPQTGYTVPSAGMQVLLHDGTPLYGVGGPPCFTPMMRTTSANVDAAGNVWTCNNWKPSFNIDKFGNPLKGQAANPGGDGVLIFVGLAKPV